MQEWFLDFAQGCWQSLDCHRFRRSPQAMQQQQLYAAGFNAWNQLRLERAPTTVHERLSAGGDTEPHDITTFECVLEAADIGPVWPSHTSTAVATSHGILTAGAVSVDAELEEPVDRSRRAEALNGHVIGCCNTDCPLFACFSRYSSVLTDCIRRSVRGWRHNLPLRAACPTGYRRCILYALRWFPRGRDGRRLRRRVCSSYSQRSSLDVGRWPVS